MVLAVIPAAAAADELATRPVVLDDNAIEARLTAEINVQARFVGRPLSIAPDVWWGILPHWTIGVIHSSASLDQIGSADTVCLRQSDITTCNRLYLGSGLDVRFGALAGQLAVAPRLRLLVRDIDPFKPATTLGALVRWTHGRFAITSDPYLRVPLANHNLGNRAALVLPVELAVQVARRWLVTMATGYDSDVVVLRDGSHIPFAVGASVRITDDLDLGVLAGWAALLGLQHDAQHGTVMISAGWHR